jgi:hypothetical protein
MGEIMKIKYSDKKFTPEHLSVIKNANKIIEEYERQSFNLTLRQLYYQFVSRDLIPNTQQEYKKLGTIISDGRLGGLISWFAIEDRTRSLAGNTHWKNPGEIIRSAANGYALDKWADQHHRVEVWIEKDALLGVIENTCEKLDIDYLSCRGYTSQSEMWRAGRRLKRYIDGGQEPVIIHLGDHDPSGKDMTRDILDRLAMFAGDHIEVKRVALNFDQIEKYTPPPNPAKITDPRAKAYIKEFGRESWELDALDPKVIDKLIQTNVLKFRDEAKWEETKEREDEERVKLLDVAATFERDEEDE